jgi:hypothetical protein
MEHDAHQKKVLALGIALLVSTVLIIFSMHDAGAHSDSLRALRVREAAPNQSSMLVSRSNAPSASSGIDGKRVEPEDHR